MTSSTLTPEPEFLVSRRAAASASLAALAFPSFRGVAGWEFTPVDKLDFDAYPAAPGGADDAAVHVLDLDLEAAVRPSSDEAVSEGPVVLPLALAAERHPDIVERHLGSLIAPDTPLVARNEAGWTDGAFVYVPRGVHVEAPIVLTTVHAQAGTTLHHRTLVVLEEGAQAEVWHQSLSADPEAAGVVNGVVELVVGQNARLRFVDAQDLSEHTWVFGSERGIVERDGTLDWITLGFGSGNGKVFLTTKLAGPGASARSRSLT